MNASHTSTVPQQQLYKLLAAKRQRLQLHQQLNYQPHTQQLAFHKAGATARERLFLAGNRCGKTLAGAYEVVMHLTGIYPSWWRGACFAEPIAAWAASQTTEMTRDILQQTYMNILPQSLLGAISHKRGIANAIDMISVRHITGGWSTLGFKSYDQGRAKFQGTARHLIHLDEEPEIDIYEECLLRTATLDGHILLTMTPLLGMTDLCHRFLSQHIHHRQVIRAGWNDAPHLAEAEKQSLRLSLRPHEIEAREQGTPRLGAGKVFPIEEEDIQIKRFTVPPCFKRVFGIDFGWTNPTAIVWGAYDDEQDILYITDCHLGAEQTPAEHTQVIHQYGSWIPGVCDPAGQAVNAQDGTSVMDIYARHGVYLTRADNAVEAGLLHMLERMRTGRLKVFSDLEPWWREFRLYRRNTKGRVAKEHDHLMDATRYLVMTGLTLARPPPERGQPIRPSRDAWSM